MKNIIFEKKGIEVLEKLRAGLNHPVTLMPSERHLNSEGKVSFEWYDELITNAENWWKDENGCFNGLPSLPVFDTKIINNQFRSYMSWETKFTEIFVGRNHWMVELYAVPNDVQIPEWKFRFPLLAVSGTSSLLVAKPFCHDCVYFKDSLRDLENAIKIFAEVIKLRGNTWCFRPYKNFLKTLLESSEEVKNKNLNIKELVGIMESILTNNEGTEGTEKELSFLDYEKVWEQYN